MTTSRSRYRVGREIQYQPTAAEAATGADVAGALWSGRIVKVNANGTVNLFIHEADGTVIPKLNVLRGGLPGQFSFIGPASAC
ncbi:MAG: hypothetical protein M3Q55_09150 [Acidobacteriota bacterium]|nr:hypothetical protein [Acidobacteriota bacterium]